MRFLSDGISEACVYRKHARAYSIPASWRVNNLRACPSSRAISMTIGHPTKVSDLVARMIHAQKKRRKHPISADRVQTLPLEGAFLCPTGTCVVLRFVRKFACPCSRLCTPNSFQPIQAREEVLERSRQRISQGLSFVRFHNHRMRLCPLVSPARVYSWDSWKCASNWLGRRWRSFKARIPLFSWTSNPVQRPRFCQHAIDILHVRPDRSHRRPRPNSIVCA